MKALILEAKDTLRIVEKPVPTPRKDESLITVDLAGIGGSEYLALGNPGIRPLPHVMGHGITGTGRGGMPVAVYPLQGCGTCSSCNRGTVQLCDHWSLIGVHSDGGFQQQLAVPGSAIVDLPPTLTRRQAAFVEPFANAINACDMAALHEHHSIAVVGAGGLGLGIIACAAARGVRHIGVAEPSASRRRAARHLGASDAAPSLEGSHDVVFDTVGSKDARNTALALTSKGGKCVFLGFATAAQPVNFTDLIRQQKQLVGSFVYSRRQFEQAMQLAHRCQDDWVKEVSMGAVENHLRAFQRGDFDVIKLALNPAL